MNENAIRALGYIVIEMHPGKYRIRGLVGYVDYWPNMGLWSSGWNKEKFQCSHVEEAIARLAPYPMPTEEEREAQRIWLEGIEEVHDRIGCLLSTQGSMRDSVQGLE